MAASSAGLRIRNLSASIPRRRWGKILAYASNRRRSRIGAHLRRCQVRSCAEGRRGHQHHRNDREADWVGDPPTEIPVQEVGERVGRCCRGRCPERGGSAAETEHADHQPGTESELKGPSVVEEVPVVRLKGGHLRVERGWIGERPGPETEKYAGPGQPRHADEDLSAHAYHFAARRET